VDSDQSELLAKYVDAFQRYDMEQLVTLLHDDALMTMPPYAMWVRGAENITRWMVEPSPSQCAGSIMVPAGQVNGVRINKRKRKKEKELKNKKKKESKI